MYVDVDTCNVEKNVTVALCICVVMVCLLVFTEGSRVSSARWWRCLSEERWTSTRRRWRTCCRPTLHGNGFQALE